jgi:hypothetical protein
MKSLANPAEAAEILARLRVVGPSSARRWGRMTPGEMLCHLADACDCAFARRPSSSIENAFRRTVVKFVALRAPMKWPHGIRTLPEFDPRLAGTKPELFEADRERTMRVVRELADLELEVDGARHPIFGRMSVAEWKRWGYLHADHHLRQFSA